VPRDQNKILGLEGGLNYFIVTEPVTMSSKSFYVRYFVKPYESKETFDEHSKTLGNPNYAGSIFIFGMPMKHDEHEGHHKEPSGGKSSVQHQMMTNKVRKSLLVNKNPIIQKNHDRVRVLTVVVDLKGNKMDIPPGDEGLLKAEVKTKKAK